MTDRFVVDRLRIRHSIAKSKETKLRDFSGLLTVVVVRECVSGAYTAVCVLCVSTACIYVYERDG